MMIYLFHKLMLWSANWLPSILVAVTGDSTGGAEHHGGGHAASGPPHLPSLLGLLFKHDSVVYLWSNPIYSLATTVIMCSAAVAVYRKRSVENPGRLQNFVEMLVEGMYTFFQSILGHEARRYTPFLGTLFFYILINNLWGLIPFGHSPSTSINVTGTLAITVFCYAEWIGISRLGFLGWVDHLAGSPRDVISWCLVPLMIPLHIVGELAKPLSLSLRLFGNITGEDVLIAAFVGLGISALAFVPHSPIGLPLDVPFILLGMLLSLIQALVFTLLSSVYILMMLPHEEAHGTEQEHLA
jgi:F-type H+-transporting ATPase subunit a